MQNDKNIAPTSRWYQPIYNVLHTITGWFSSTHWGGLRKFFTGKESPLTEDQLAKIKVMLAQDYYIILTFQASHLSNWLINILTYIKTRQWPKYSHALMNVDSETDPAHPENFKLMEATHAGVHWGTFEEVFTADNVCLLSPARMPKAAWTAVIDKLVKQENKPYDDLFDLADDTHLSCVELVWDALQADGTYADDFNAFLALITKTGNLTPQMFRDCEDFTVDLEILKGK